MTAPAAAVAAARAASARDRGPSSRLGGVKPPAGLRNGVVALRMSRSRDHAVRLHSLRNHALYVAPIRIGLGALWLGGAHLAGVSSASTLLACAGGVFVIVFIGLNDPRMAGLGVAGILRAFALDSTLWWDREGGVYRREHGG